ncbi:MAG: hypothetical protein U0414_28475 [Polyangiaceae bacterium]
MTRARAVLVCLLLAFGTTACNVDWDRIWDAFSSKSKKRSSRRIRREAEDEPSRSKKDPEPRSEEATILGDLGVAAFPDGTRDPRVFHDWDSPAIPPKKFSLTYTLSRRAADDVEERFKRYADSVRYVSGEEHRFKWVPPAGCSGDMGCVFQELTEEDRDAIQPVVALFKKRQQEAKLGTLELAQLIVNFVQDIRYFEPDDAPFGMLPPALVLSRSNGDCDSKSLLAKMLLGEFGIDSIMLSSALHRHAMLGIALPVKGTKMIVEGREYAFTELTAKGAVIGYLFPDQAKPNDWKPVLLRRPKFAPAPKPR